MKNLIEAIVIAIVTNKIDLMVFWIDDKIIHFMMNPIKGGIPAIDKISTDIVIILFFVIWWINIFIFLFLNFMIKGIEIVMYIIK